MSKLKFQTTIAKTEKNGFLPTSIKIGGTLHFFFFRTAFVSYERTEKLTLKSASEIFFVVGKKFWSNFISTMVI